MTIRAISLAVVGTLATWGAGSAAEPNDVLERPLRQAVARSLPFLEQEGTAWMKQRKCIACHHVPYLLWAHRAAASHGFPVAPRKLREWDAWALAFYPEETSWFKLDEQKLRILKRSLPAAVAARLQTLVGRGFSNRAAFLAELATVLSAEEVTRHEDAVLLRASHYRHDGGPFHVSQLLLGRAEAGAFAPLETYLLRHQEDDGSWKTVLTQFTHQKRLGPEMQEAITMWTVLALNSSKQADARPALERASAWLKDVRPGQTTESVALVLMLRRDRHAKELLGELLKRQNEDGGWSWFQGQPSDALATGQTLYALARVGMPAGRGVLERAQAYLLKTQREDGSWSVPARQFSAKTDAAYLKSADAVYAYWGTGWATVGLLQLLP
jgi:hypothetical protein